MLDANSPEIKEIIMAYNFGPAKMAQRDEYKYAMNYISGYDFVPLFDPFGYIKARNSENITFLPSGKNPIYDHSWTGESYDNTLQNLYKNFAKQSGAKE